MSIPAWQYKLEDVEFKMRDKPMLIIDWLLTHPSAKEIPEGIRNARLAKYGYKPALQEPKTVVTEPEVVHEIKTRTRNPKIRPFDKQERQASVIRQKENRDE
jgi:hypothetical protein